MPRPRTNDPAGVSDNPVTVRDPHRVAEVTAEFRRRLDYIERHYHNARASLGHSTSFNESLARLNRAVAGKASGPIKRLHPEIEIKLHIRARQHASARSGNVDEQPDMPDVAKAAADVVTAIKPRRGRPEDAVLRHHVEGLVALVQDSCGTPVLMTRYKDSLYAPQALNGLGAVVIHMVQWIAPGTPVETIVNIVRAARRRHAGRPMHFRDFFPLYGATIDPATLLPTGGIGCRVESFEMASPIYCP